MSKPRTKKVVHTEGREVEVDVKENDSVDIRCGGPRTLGYDWFVAADENKKSLEKFIRAELEKNGVPCMGIYIRDKEFRPGKIWTRAMIAKNIKEDHDF